MVLSGGKEVDTKVSENQNHEKEGVQLSIKSDQEEDKGSEKASPPSIKVSKPNVTYEPMAPYPLTLSAPSPSKNIRNERAFLRPLSKLRSTSSS